MTNCFFHFLILFFLLLAGGCVKFDYTGQRFTPRAESAPVAFLDSQADFTAQGFRIIGRGILTVPGKTASYDSMGELRERAREYGAEAVCIVDSQIAGERVFSAPEDEFVSPYKAQAVKVENSSWDAKFFGSSPQLGTVKGTPEKVIRVLFLKKTVNLEKELQQKNPLL
jgi:hypothetical protein